MNRSHNNLVFHQEAREAWAVYKLLTRPYEGLPMTARSELRRKLASILATLQSDFSVLRIAYPWDVNRYQLGVMAKSDVRYVHRKSLEEHLDRQRRELSGRELHTAGLFLSVRLQIAHTTELGLPAAAAAEERELHERVRAYVALDRAASEELRRLTRRAYARGLRDPVGDQESKLQALVRGPHEQPRQWRRPLVAEALRPIDSPIHVEATKLRIITGRGESHQAFLVVPALPDLPTATDQAEFLFSPLEAVAFPVDAALHIRREQGLRKPSLSLAIGATTAAELEARVDLLRREYGSLELTRPAGAQFELFFAHLPGRSPLRTRLDHVINAPRLRAVLPTAPRAVGTAQGPCVGYALDGVRQPVLFDIEEAAGPSRTRATLLAGGAGSGKTVCMQLIMHQRALAGSVICDIDTRGDHVLDRLPGTGEVLEVIELSTDECHRGVLDPLRIAPRAVRATIAHGFLLDILPEGTDPVWEIEIAQAVRSVIAAGGDSCGAVIRVLERGSASERRAAGVLRGQAARGLGVLGVAEPGTTLSHASSRQVTSLRVRDLAHPPPGTMSTPVGEEQRVHASILRLIGVYGLRLITTSRHPHAVLGFDDASVLLKDAAGRSLLSCIVREASTRNISVLLASRVACGRDQLDSLGSILCFGVEDVGQARTALRLLGLQEHDEALQQELISNRHGRCLLRDHEGRVGAFQVDPLDPQLRSLLGTVGSEMRVAPVDGSG